VVEVLTLVDVLHRSQRPRCTIVGLIGHNTGRSIVIRCRILPKVHVIGKGITVQSLAGWLSAHLCTSAQVDIFMLDARSYVLVLGALLSIQHDGSADIVHATAIATVAAHSRSM
jgi:hypothetical protein